MPIQTTFTPSTYNSSSGTGFIAGALYSNGDGKEYRFVNFVSAGADGAIMCVYDTSGSYVIGANRTTGLAGTPAATMFVGIAVGTVTAGNWGFVQTDGNHLNVLSGTSTLGRWQCPIATNDSAGDATASIARTESIFGRCIVATSGGRAGIRLGMF